MGPDTRYVVLAEVGGGGGLRPPPVRGKPPKYPPHAKKRKSSGCSFCGCYCCCCCCCVLLIFLVIVALIGCIVFLNPKVPSYSVKNLALTAFDVSDDLSLNIKISVSIRAENPNNRIGITYGEKSKVALSFKETKLCSAKLPSFYQGYGNVTTLDIVMAGSSKFGKEMQDDLAEGQKSGNIPLDLLVVVPIKLRVLDLDTRPITVTVNCTLVVDNFQPNTKVGIKSSHYDVTWLYD